MRCGIVERRLEYVVPSQVRAAFAGKSNHGSHCLNNGTRGAVGSREETARNQPEEEEKEGSGRRPDRRWYLPNKSEWLLGRRNNRLIQFHRQTEGTYTHRTAGWKLVIGDQNKSAKRYRVIFKHDTKTTIPFTLLDIRRLTVFG